MSHQVWFELLDYSKVKTGARVERGLLRRTFSRKSFYPGHNNTNNSVPNSF